MDQQHQYQYKGIKFIDSLSLITYLNHTYQFSTIQRKVILQFSREQIASSEKYWIKGKVSWVDILPKAGG